MGNASSSTSASASSQGRITDTPGGGARSHAETGGDGDDAAVSVLYGGMRDSFAAATRGMNRNDRDLLLFRLHERLLHDCPFLDASADAAAQNDNENSKKRKQSKIPVEQSTPGTDAQPEGEVSEYKMPRREPRIAQPFRHVPEAVVANVARFCLRTDQNSLALASGGIFRNVIENRDRMTKYWPTVRPFPLPRLPGEQWGDGFPWQPERQSISIYFSQDTTALAVFKDAVVVNDHEIMAASLEVYRLSCGRLGRLNCGHNLTIKPVFSPNNTLIAFGTRDLVFDYTTIVHLPTMRVVYESMTEDASDVQSIDFLDDDTVLFVCGARVVAHKIVAVREGGSRLRLTEPETVLAIPDHKSPEFPWESNDDRRLTSFPDKELNEWIAVTYRAQDGGRAVLIHDLDSNVSVTRPLPSKMTYTKDIAFSPDGKKLVVSGSRSGLVVFDCNVSAIEKISEVTTIPLAGPLRSASISFSPKGTSVILCGIDNVKDQIRVVHLESGQSFYSSWKELAISKH